MSWYSRLAMLPRGPSKTRLGVLLVAGASAVGLPAAACGYFGGGETAIATIAGEPVTRAAFDEYVEGVLSDDANQDRESPSPQLLSRLLDRFLEEEIVIREAERRGIRVEEREITEALQGLRNPEVAAPRLGSEAEYRRLRDRVHRSLITEKFREERILKTLSVSTDEVATYYQEHRDEFRESSRVVLRQILLEDAEEARELRRELIREPDRFQTLAEERSLSPDGGRALSYNEMDLPPDLREAISSVQPGEISKVATGSFGSRIFLLEKREPEREIGVDEAYERIRVVLYQEKSREAYDAVIGRLREQAGLVIREESLPFPYRKSES